RGEGAHGRARDSAGASPLQCALADAGGGACGSDGRDPARVLRGVRSHVQSGVPARANGLLAALRELAALLAAVSGVCSLGPRGLGVLLLSMAGPAVSGVRLRRV